MPRTRRCRVRGPRGIGEGGLLLPGPLEQAVRPLRFHGVLRPPLEEPAAIGPPRGRVGVGRHEGLERRERRRLVRGVDAHVGEDVAVRPRRLVDPRRVAPHDARAGQQDRHPPAPAVGGRGTRAGQGRIGRLLEGVGRACGDREAFERGEGVGPSRRELEGSLRLARRAHGVAQTHLEHLGGSQRQGDALGVVGGLIGDGCVEPGQVGPAPGVLAEGGEAGVDLGILGGDLPRVPVQASRVRLVARAIGEVRGALPDGGGGLEVAPLVGVEVRQALEPRDLLCGVARHLCASLEDGPREVGVAEEVGRLRHRVEAPPGRGSGSSSSRAHWVRARSASPCCAATRASVARTARASSPLTRSMRDSSSAQRSCQRPAPEKMSASAACASASSGSRSSRVR